MHNHRDTNKATGRRLSALARVASLLAAHLAASGCSVGPNFTRPEASVNENWGARGDPRIATQTAADGLWWKTFDDVALNQLVELASRQNLPLQVAGLRILEARARLGVATGLQFPQVQEVFADGAAVGLNKQFSDAVNVNRNFLYYQAGFDAVWELDFWGKYRRGVEAEAAALLGSITDYYYVLISLTAEVARTYVAVRTYEVLIEQARQNADIQEQGLRIAESRLRNGATSELDVSQATTLLESTRASIPQLRIKLEQGQNALSTLLGQTTGAIGNVLVSARGIPKVPVQVAVSVPAEMLRRRPDIRSAELLAAAQCARIGIAKADLYPSFSLFGTIGLRAATIGSGSSNLFSSDALTYSVGPRIVWPFFNYGRLKNNVRVEDARFQQLLVDYQSTVLKAAQEVEDALSGFLRGQEAMIFEQNSVKAAQRSVEIALTQYQEGAADYQRVLDAQRSLLQQQNELTQTNSSVATSLIAVYKALGGGWEARQGQPFVPERIQHEMKERTDWGDLLSEPRSPENKNRPSGKH